MVDFVRENVDAGGSLDSLNPDKFIALLTAIRVDLNVVVDLAATLSCVL